MRWPWSKNIIKTIVNVSPVCAKCGEKVTAGINENNNTYHINCKP